MTGKEVRAKVYAPIKFSPLREGRGFSLREIREAGLTKGEAKRLGIFIDPRRKTAHPHNIELLKDIVEEEKREKGVKEG